MGYNVRVRFLLALFFMMIVSGCGGSVIRYINPAADFSYIQKVAVLPFNNLSDDKYAGERVRSAFTIDLLSREVFDVVEQGEVNNVLSVIVGQSGAAEGKAVNFDKETLSLIGEKLGVRAVIMGSVDDYKKGGFGAGSTVALSVRLLDTGSGTILWQARSIESGGSFWRKMLGLDELDNNLLTQKAVRSALNTLF